MKQIQKNTITSAALICYLTFILLTPVIAQKTKKYEEVIPFNAETQRGLITTHKVDEKYYFELSEHIFQKDILIVSRISGMPHKFSPFGAGVCTKLNSHQVIRFQRDGNSILMRLTSYDDVVDEELPIYQSVRQNNFEPIIYIFNVETYGLELNSCVINITDFFTSDIPLIGVKGSGISGLDRSRSIISSIKVFPQNVEITHILTYRVSDRPDTDRNSSLSFELNQSFFLLPENPMIPRLYHEGIGFFSLQQIDYGNKSGTVKRSYITRWRLEPSDWTLFKNGYLVEPVNPIIYHIDPATPEKWRPYIRQGVEDWQDVFESIGFRNAILVKEHRERKEEPDFDINNFTYSVIRYIATERGTASGFTVHDPRTGEILKADIHWGHNKIDYIKKRFFVQTAAANPEARAIEFKDEVTGELIRQVISHEVGHTLGLEHNMLASSAYPVDSLRSPSFTAVHGLSPSIMDYAWGNYIAQPQDGVMNFYTKIGEYDYWAIKLGYSPIAEDISPEKDKNQIDQWIEEKANDVIYQARGISGRENDMDLGDDAIEAAKLGIQNLRIIMNNLVEWGTKEGEDYTHLTELHREALDQFYRCLDPLINKIGNCYYLNKTFRQNGVVYQFITEEEQKQCLQIIADHLFQTPEWLINSSIQQRINSGLTENGTMNNIRHLHMKVLNRLLANPIHMIEDEALNGERAYTISELYNDLRKIIFSELETGEQIDTYRRNLQKMMVERFELNLNTKTDFYRNTDITSVALSNLLILAGTLRKGIRRQKDKHSKDHLLELKMKVERILKLD